MKHIIILIAALICLNIDFAQAGSPVYGRGASSGSDVSGRMLLNSNVYGRKQESNVYRGGQTIGEVIMSTPGLVAYWPLTSNGTELKGDNSMVLTNVTFTTGAAYFNGTDAYGASNANVDLSGTNKATIIVTVKAVVLTDAVKMYVEQSLTTATNQGVILAQTNASPFSLFTQVRGNVGQNNSVFSQSSFAWGINDNVFFCSTYDTSLVNPETSLYANGKLLTLTTQASSANNTANLVSDKVYIGSRGMINNFANIYMRNLAIFSNTISNKNIIEMSTAQ